MTLTLKDDTEPGCQPGVWGEWWLAPHLAFVLGSHRRLQQLLWPLEAPRQNGLSSA